VGASADTNDQPHIHTPEPRAVSQKHGPSPPVSNKAPALFQTRLIKTDELLSNAQRAPEGFQCWQGIEATTVGARCGDVGS